MRLLSSSPDRHHVRRSSPLVLVVATRICISISPEAITTSNSCRLRDPPPPLSPHPLWGTLALFFTRQHGRHMSPKFCLLGWWSRRTDTSHNRYAGWLTGRGKTSWYNLLRASHQNQVCQNRYGRGWQEEAHLLWVQIKPDYKKGDFIFQKNKNKKKLDHVAGQLPNRARPQKRATRRGMPGLSYRSIKNPFLPWGNPPALAHAPREKADFSKKTVSAFGARAENWKIRFWHLHFN